MSKARSKFDWSANILFVMSTSVILITFGIIQTLVFEAWNFFSELADSRGWLNIDWNFSGIFSNDGFAAIVILSAFGLERYLRNKKTVLKNLPSDLFHPNLLVKVGIWLVVLLTLFFGESLWIFLCALCTVLIWRRIANLQEATIRGGDGEVSGSEECDDGNTISGDCCSASCAFEAVASPCEDGDLCTGGEVCDGAGLQERLLKRWARVSQEASRLQARAAKTSSRTPQTAPR